MRFHGITLTALSAITVIAISSVQAIATRNNDPYVVVMNPGLDESPADMQIGIPVQDHMLPAARQVPMTFTRWNATTKSRIDDLTDITDRENYARRRAELAMSMFSMSSLVRAIHAIMDHVHAQANYLRELTSFMDDPELVAAVNDPSMRTFMSGWKSKRITWSWNQLRHHRRNFFVQVRVIERQAQQLLERFRAQDFTFGGWSASMHTENFQSRVFRQQLRVGDMIMHRAYDVTLAMMKAERKRAIAEAAG